VSSGQTRAQVAQDLRWWSPQEGRETHQIVEKLLDSMKTQQAYRRDACEYYARQYAGPQIASLNALRAGAQSSVSFKANSLSFNVIASVCNTVQAKIAKNRPLPKFVTNGGDWSQQRKAKMLSKFVEGEFDRTGVWELDPLIVLHACVWGEGVLKVYRDEDEIHVEPEFPWRVFTDEQESQYGLRGVRSCYQRKPVDRLVLAEMFPSHADWILHDAHNLSSDEDYGTGIDVVADQIVVTECWHLRSGKKAKDGRHAIVIAGRTLLVEDYAYDYFPFVWLRRNDALMGAHAAGFAESLTGIQREVNFVARRVQEAHYRMGGSHWAVENSAKVRTESLNNGQATVMRYTGVAPIPNHVPPFHPQTYEYLHSLIPKAYEMVGVSQLSAMAKKPAGLDSGASIREYNDTESEGFVVFAKQFENFHVQLAKQMLDLLRELVATNKDYAVNVRGKRFLKKIRFADVSLEPDSYIVECFPTSMLPHTPAGRLAQVESLFKGGLISDVKEARRLVAFPDLEAANNQADSSHELVEEMLDRMLDEGLYQSPESYMDLVDALHTAQTTYLQARADGAPEDVLDLVRDFIGAAKDLLDAQLAASAPPPDRSAMPGAPPAPAPAPPIAV
jgi:hypothetical protein